jgi:hypothetical protein
MVDLEMRDEDNNNARKNSATKSQSQKDYRIILLVPLLMRDKFN